MRQIDYREGWGVILKYADEPFVSLGDIAELEEERGKKYPLSIAGYALTYRHTESGVTVLTRPALSGAPSCCQTRPSAP